MTPTARACRPAATGLVLAALTIALLAAACGQPAKHETSAGTTTSAPTTETTLATTTTASTTTTTRPTTTASIATTTTTAPPSTTASPPATAATRLIDQIADQGAGTTKVMTVDSPSWSSDTATVILWQRGPTGWVQVAGPWSAWTGGAGWSYQPGESTRRSPVGSFSFGIGFGVSPNPGYRLGWFVVGPTDYWVEDPASSVYNTHQQWPAGKPVPWGHDERLIEQPVAYQYAALIDFNVPVWGHGRGSGIFLHVSKGASTAGCVSLPVPELLTALRWIDGHTRIVMGPDSVIRGLRPGT
jgi:L,D-peptidoglycan transpeptidase YkuD (ErfK/YbiS/YcfS/YnhG family)